MKYFSFKKKLENHQLFLDEKKSGDNIKNVLEARFSEDNFSVDLLVNDSNDQKEVIEKRFNNKKAGYLLAISLFLILILFFRVFYLQIIKGDYYHSLAEGNRIRIQSVKAQRGVFFDRLGRQLVTNIPVFTLELIPADLPKNEEARESLLAELNQIINFSREEIREAIKKTPRFSYQPIVVKENIDHKTALLLKIKSEELPGVVLETDYRRKYIIEDDNFLTSLSHILGYTGKISADELPLLNKKDYLMTDYLGKYGLELTKEKELRGNYGKKQVEVNALGKESKVIAEDKALPGYNLVLTIDLDLQKRVEEILTEALIKSNSERGAVVVLNPQNGEVLALVSLPSFNNNNFSEGISVQKYQELLNNPNHPLFNRIIAGEYPSGSTIKPVIASAALEEGIITEQTTINSIGGIQIKDWFFPDWKAGGHGPTNVIKAIAESVNTFFYYIGGGYNDFPGLGVDKIVKYAQMFGLNHKTDIELTGEKEGFLPTKEWKEKTKNEPWYIGDTYHMSIGQGDLLVTPLQVAVYMSFFANKDILYQPHLVKSLVDQDKKVISEIKQKIINQDFINSQHIKTVRAGLREAVLSGSSRGLSILPIAVAGKTGTAQWSTDKNKKPHAWFTCFAPYNDPQLVITVLIEEGGEGSETALPVAKEILTWWFSPK